MPGPVCECAEPVGSSNQPEICRISSPSWTLANSPLWRVRTRRHSRGPEGHRVFRQTADSHTSRPDARFQRRISRDVEQPMGRRPKHRGKRCGIHQSFLQSEFEMEASAGTPVLLQPEENPQGRGVDRGLRLPAQAQKDSMPVRRSHLSRHATIYVRLIERFKKPLAHSGEFFVLRIPRERCWCVTNLSHPCDQ